MEQASESVGAGKPAQPVSGGTEIALCIAPDGAMSITVEEYTPSEDAGGTPVETLDQALQAIKTLAMEATGGNVSQGESVAPADQQSEEDAMMAGYGGRG